MNIEEQLKQTNELLKKVLLRTYADTEDEKKAKQEEIEELDETIEKYQIELDELTKKIADENNYKRIKSDFELNERPIVEELLADSIADEREEVFKYNQSLRKCHEQQTKMLDIYNDEISKLKDEITNIEARLNKDAIAKKRGIAKKLHLTDDEVFALQEEINYKKELIEEGNQVIEICLDEIKRYDRLIADNNNRLNYITNKEQRLTTILCNKHDNVSDIDRYQMRLDRDEINKKVSALESLRKRKEYLLYDPTKEIKDQLKQNEDMLNGLQENKENTNTFSKVNSDDIPNNALEEENKEELEENPTFQPFAEEPKQPVAEKGFEPIPPERALTKPEHLELVKMYDAPEELKKQKLSDRIKKAWNKWREKAIAVAVAAAITITGGKLFSNMNQENKFEKVDNQIEQPNEQVKDDIEDNFTFENPSNNNQNNLGGNVNSEVNKEPMVEPGKKDDLVTKPVQKDEVNVQPPVVEQPKFEEIVAPAPTIPEVTPEIPEVEEEKPIEEIQPQKPSFEGVINTDEMETTILQTEGEYVDIPLKNGEVAFVKYGDNGENVPTDIVIKYVGTDMYIYSPIVNSKRL